MVQGVLVQKSDSAGMEPQKIDSLKRNSTTLAQFTLTQTHYKMLVITSTYLLYMEKISELFRDQMVTEA